MKAKNINTDIEGIIREINLSESEVMYPLFEAIVNAIQSIHEIYADKSNKIGEITLDIVRDRSETTLFEEYSEYPIKAITIVDNGVGFTSSNYESFQKSHSTKKASIGGKGVGRFTMLSVFDKIEIDSSYADIQNKTMVFRQFELSRKDGLREEEEKQSKSTNNRTKITLLGLNEKFKKISAKYTQENIADAILEHCLLYYLNGNVPKIRIIENDEAIDLSNQFTPSDFVIHEFKDKIKGNDFTCYIVKSDKVKAHEYFLCAHNRKVKSKRIDKVFPIFSSKVKEGDEEVYLQAYVVSKYLDDRVNTARNEIKFPKLKDDFDEDDAGVFDATEEFRTVVIERDIDNFIKNGISDKYIDVIEQRQTLLRNAVDQYISSDEGLEYRTLDIDSDFLSTIPDVIETKKLDDILHEHQYRSRIKLKKKRERLLDKDFSRRKDYQDLLLEVASLVTKEGNIKLGQYVAHRKTIIDLLERYLDWCDKNGNYEEEATLHNLVFAMGGTHEDTPYDSHNLWLLDDRLSFHRHIYSDIAIKRHASKKGKTNSRRETDLAIYDIPYTYGEKTEYGEVASAVIFEFKRPNRNLTYEEFNKQMNDQVEAVNAGKIVDKNGRHVATSESTPVFFYYVCDVNAYSSLKPKAELNGFNETPYKSMMRLVKNIYVEIITYQTLLINSKRRNKTFFKKLGIE